VPATRTHGSAERAFDAVDDSFGHPAHVVAGAVNADSVGVIKM